MPCWEVNTVTLKFNARNKEMLVQVLKDMQLSPYYRDDGNIETYIGTFDLKSGEVRTQSYNSQKVNEVRKKYSEAALMVAAKKNKWVVKRRSPNQFVAKKW
jgi:recombinational DNA repair protein RecT